MKNYFYFLIVILVLLNSCSKDLTCSDFKFGTFYIPNDSDINKKDYVIERNGNSQIEYSKKGSKSINYINIEWIDDCTCRLTYDKNRTNLNTAQKKANESGGILLEKVKIEGNCMTYKTIGYINDEMVELISKICKE